MPPPREKPRTARGRTVDAERCQHLSGAGPPHNGKLLGREGAAALFLLRRGEAGIGARLPSIEVSAAFCRTTGGGNRRFAALCF
jgi:hypothetical protein